MKTNTAKNIVAVNVLESADYTISEDSKIFDMLMSNLYADKITSITREIYTNALDAHIDGDCAERPFEVSLPNMLTPVFTVRDYGVSLTHNQVMTLYTSLGKSTKEGTNKTAGKWGIGSKAPFAYTDTYTVTAVKDGVRTFYAATKNEENKPVINVMGREETTDEEGVEVSFPVHKEDIVSFRTAAHRVAFGFDVKPLVMNENDHEWESLPVMLEGTGWKLLSEVPTGFDSGSYAQMGPVLYPITASAMGDITRDQKHMLEYQFIFDFPMGDLSISISRESLSYGRKDPTQAAILARIDAAMNELEERFVNKYAEMDTLWNATEALAEDYGSGNIPSPVRDAVHKRAYWQGQKLGTSIECSMAGSLTASHIPSDKLSNKVIRFKQRPHWDNDEPTTVSIAPRRNPLIVIEDLSMDKPVNRVGERIKRFAEQSSHRTVVWFKFYAGREASPAMAEILEQIEGATIVLAHELEVPDRPSRARGEYVPVQAREFNGYGFDSKITLTAEEYDEGGFYVKMERGEICDHVNHSSARSALVMLGALENGTRIIGVPKTMWKRFSGDQWTDFAAFAKTVQEDRKAKLNGSMEVYHAQREVRRNDIMTYLERHIDVSKLAKNSAVADALAFRAEVLDTDTSEAEAVMGLTSACGRHVEDGEPLATDSEYGVHTELLAVTYPLLDSLHDHWGFNRKENHVDMLTEYVNMCDNA